MTAPSALPTCPEHPTQPAIHCACPAGEAIHPCRICETEHAGPTCDPRERR